MEKDMVDSETDMVDYEKEYTEEKEQGERDETFAIKIKAIIEEDKELEQMQYNYNKHIEEKLKRDAIEPIISNSKILIDFNTKKTVASFNKIYKSLCKVSKKSSKLKEIIKLIKLSLFSIKVPERFKIMKKEEFLSMKEGNAPLELSKFLDYGFILNYSSYLNIKPVNSGYLEYCTIIELSPKKPADYFKELIKFIFNRKPENA